MKRAPLNGARFLGGPNRPEKVILIPNPANCHFRMILPANPKAAAPPWYVRRNGCFPSIAYLSLLPTCFCLTDNVVHTLSRETACDITEDVAIFINHEGRRERGNTIRRVESAACVHQNGISIAVLREKSLNVLYAAFPADIGSGYAENDQIPGIAPVIEIKLLDVRHFLTAGRAPGCPEIKKYSLAFIIR